MFDAGTRGRIRAAIENIDLVARLGTVRRIMPTFIEADGPNVPIGSLCALDADGGEPITAEVIRVDAERVTLVPFAPTSRTRPGARVRALSREGDQVAVGDVFLGRAVNALGQPIDDGPTISSTRQRSIQGHPLKPMERISPTISLTTGIRAIDGFLTLGIGQRVGVFAGSGVGKTTLVTQMIQGVEADCCVICLVGERGREAQMLWSQGLSEKARARATMVVATADEPAALRCRAALFALALAEQFRDQGLHVVLVLDSVTRLAMAMREIGLAAGEPPTVRAFTPSVFANLPRLVERCGAAQSGGAITAIMTVLTESDAADDPLAELMKSLLDGHVVLSRELAEQGHFPAINVPRSVSRMARQLCEPALRQHVSRAIGELSLYESSRMLIEAGMYEPGTNPELDRALARRPRLTEFLRQAPDQAWRRADTLKALEQMMAHEGNP